MFKLKGFFNGKEFQCMANDYSSAIRILKRSRKKASCMVLLNEKGEEKAVYLRGIGTSLQTS